MTPPREPDRYDKQAEEIVDRLNAGLERYDQDAIARALRAAEASALERAARLVDDSDLYICGDEIRALASPAPSPEAPPDLTGHQCVSCAPPEPVAPTPSATEPGHVDSEDCECIACCDKWLDEMARAFRASGSAAWKRIAELEAALRSVEWMLPPQGENPACCLSCGGAQPHHVPGCRIDAALSRTASPGAPGKEEGW